MQARELNIQGAYVFTPDIHRDARGFFVSPLLDSALTEAVGHSMFPVRQMSLSQSRRGVVRGVHYTRTPPGNGKFVHCPAGRVVDYIVDLRVGSPTFGNWDSVVLDRETCRSIYLPVGLGHAFAALRDDTVVSYMLTVEYVPENELAVSILDPELGIELPAEIEPQLSERDTAAESVAAAKAAGRLPDYAECRAIDATF
ncbi:epimerase EvaD [Tamaricihabitans halophyticus]|uniref:Epimerase EvaD n=1 Tax=Tamaricihabitans halophyticus TaxID=1262583 RepID=A0A4R2QUN9_9PSEU|nr:dTDP-4-dehydrorhamnose 3,5-epimerase family protein [Tamaricihabitans halophyticus]TCP53437.1 epimerase EvaD [Tamaricihabitans halophyticus]